MLTIASMLGLAYLMNYSGMTSTLGLALAATGGAFPFFSAVVGWLGVFLTGSDTSANALFGNLQVVTANALGLNPVLTASVNSAAGVMGKMISVQSIAVAVAATGMTSADESRLFRFTIKHSVLLMVVMGLLSLLFAYVVSGSVPVCRRNSRISIDVARLGPALAGIRNMSENIPVVAILNSNDDVVELLRMALEQAGLVVVSAHVDAVKRGDASLLEFMREHRPDVVLYDVVARTDRSWRFLEHLRDTSMRGQSFVITSTNPNRARELAGTTEDIYEIVGKPYDIDKIVDAVRGAARLRR